jgi:hypothetical protein
MQPDLETLIPPRGTTDSNVRALSDQAILTINSVSRNKANIKYSISQPNFKSKQGSLIA